MTDASGEAGEGESLDQVVNLLRDRTNDLASALTGEIQRRRETDDELARRVRALAEQIEGKKESTQTPHSFAECADDVAWKELYDWVDWHNATYVASVPGCWPKHPGIVEEFAALWRAWQAAHVPPLKSRTSAQWHESRAKTIERILAGMRKCESAHSPQPNLRTTIRDNG